MADTFLSDMMRREYQKSEEKRSQERESERVREVLREEEWRQVGRGSVNSPSGSHLSRKRQSLLPPVVVPHGLQVDLLPFQLAPGAFSQERNQKQRHDRENAITSAYAEKGMLTHSQRQIQKLKQNVANQM